MIIREFSEQDIDEITSLMKKLCSLKARDFNEKRWRSSLERRMKNDTNSEVFVAFDEETNEVLGMANVSIKERDPEDRFGYLSNLIVKEEKRRSGIGESLLNHVVDYFRHNHIQSILLALDSKLENAAKLLFVKKGFRELYRIFELKI